MYCKDCVYYVDGDCTNKKLCEVGETVNFDENNSLIYSYNEGGWFSPQEYFGCVHFKDKFKDGYGEGSDEDM